MADPAPRGLVHPQLRTVVPASLSALCTASAITVGLRYDGIALSVSVTDDGRGGTQLPAAAHGGGFGLVGLKERVTAVGGELHAGPCAGGGWEVRGLFPAGERRHRDFGLA